MKKAKTGNTVIVNYFGKLKDNTKVLASPDNKPLKFTLGQSEVIKGFQEAILGMEEGESKTIDIPPEKAFGPHQEKNIIEFDKSRVPEAAKNNLKEGRNLELIDPSGEKVVATVNKITKDKVVLDTNHFLAGKELTFDITLLEIE